MDGSVIVAAAFMLACVGFVGGYVAAGVLWRTLLGRILLAWLVVFVIAFLVLRGAEVVGWWLEVARARLLLMSRY